MMRKVTCSGTPKLRAGPVEACILQSNSSPGTLSFLLSISKCQSSQMLKTTNVVIHHMYLGMCSRIETLFAGSFCIPTTRSLATATYSKRHKAYLSSDCQWQSLKLVLGRVKSRKVLHVLPVFPESRCCRQAAR
jgi:hypothetical protein